MKKQLLFACILQFFAIFVHAQFPKNISTHPDFPVNDEFLPMYNNWANTNHTINPFLNVGFDWRLFNSVSPLTPQPIIPLELRPGWINTIKSLSSNNYFPMDNPFGIVNHVGTRSGFNSVDRDFKWEDGWELLWLNLGHYPNGAVMDVPVPGSFITTSWGPKPNHIPYFAIYNRYQGTMRLFSNVWFDPKTPIRYQDIVVKFGYYDIQATEFGNISGLLRHNGGFDLALDQPTQNYELYSARQQPVNQSEWQISEFQIGFDPCVCMRQKEKPFQSGQLEFQFQDFTAVSIDMMSRTVETTEMINSSNYANAAIDFLNLTSMKEEDGYQPGYSMYRRMNRLYDDYETKLSKYQKDSAAYHDPRNKMGRDLLKLSRAITADAVSIILPNVSREFLADVGIDNKDKQKDVDKAISNAVKGFVGIGFDYAVVSIFGRPASEPKNKPSLPVANFSETFYKGKLTYVPSEAKIEGLYIPGAFTQTPSWAPNVAHGYGAEPHIDPRLFPAYNKVLGQVALLESPSVSFGTQHDFSQKEGEQFQIVIGNQRTCYQELISTSSFDLSLKVDDALKIALNADLDFDFDKTNSYVNIEVELEKEIFIPSTSLLPDYPKVIESNSSNLVVYHTLDKQPSISTNNTKYLSETTIYNSRWVSIADASQYVFDIKENTDVVNVVKRTQEPIDVGIPITDPNTGQPIYTWVCTNDYLPHNYDQSENVKYKVKSIKLKLLHDMYFDQIGMFDEQNNSTQVYTYPIYQLKKLQFVDLPIPGSNVTLLSSTTDLKRYATGIMLLENEHITPNHNYVYETIGNIIYINAQEVDIEGEITVENGYELIIQSLYPINVKDGAKIGKNITLRIKKDWFDLDPFTYVTNEEVYAFCNDNQRYRANTLNFKTAERLQRERAEREYQEAQQKKEIRPITLYPNPTQSQVTVSGLDGDTHTLKVYDAQGVLVLSQDVAALEQTVLFLGNLARGVYIVTAERTNGSVSNSRLVKL
ncbi:MAG: T9SS type A sorting domain-containing protein [Schleiferiaceae bacterium]|nr:T9SS type A sorting domain-containing protein [Schleiferiaceae bacterium]